MSDPLFPHDEAPGPVLNASEALKNLALCAGAEFLIDHTRTRLERMEANGEVDLRSLRTNSLLSVRNPDGSRSRPTLEWMRRVYAERRLVPIGPVPEGATERQARFLMMDAVEANRRDAKAGWRRGLAWRALAEETLQTDTACGDWLGANYGRVPGDLSFPRPSGSSLRRWMRRLRKGQNRIGALVSQAGRPRNHSQLHPEMDAAMTSAALYFYTGAGISKVQSESYLDDRVQDVNARRAGTGEPPLPRPSRQALSKRIDKLECYETWARKYGKASAERKYRGAGEPLLVDHVLEIGLMDATELEQIIVFDEAWQIPALKVRIVALMCLLTHAIFGWKVYAGPNRAETSAQAYLHCLEPHKFPPRMVELHPGLRLIFGQFAAILPDNEKALIGPETVAGYNEAGTTVIPAPVEMPTAKASLERFWRMLKENLAMLPGTLIDPKRATEIGFESVEAAAEATMHQLNMIVAQVAAQHNVSGSRGLPGNCSPVEMIMSREATRATPAFVDIGKVAASLCRSFPIFVTHNGAEKDGIRYRDATAIDRLLTNNKGRLGAGRKANGITLRARRRDGDINTIEVYDEHSDVWEVLRSTQPGYTDGLSFWEHQQYSEHAKRRREAFGSERAKLASKTETRRLIEETLPKAKFRRKAAMAALALAPQVASLNGKPIVLPEDVEIAPQELADFRTDDPTATVKDASVRKTTKKRTVPDEREPESEVDDDWDDADFGEDEA